MSLQQMICTHPSVIPKVTGTKEVQTQLEEAICKSKRVLADNYDEMAIFCCHWEDDDTDSILDCDLFSNTMKMIAPVCSEVTIYSITAKEESEDWETACRNTRVTLNKSKRSLFIFYYAGHATESSTTSSLVLTQKYKIVEGDDHDSTQRDFMRINNSLLTSSQANPLMDILMVMDSCCAAVGGRGSRGRTGRIEFVAATTATGIANARQDGQTFTQAWCNAVEKLCSTQAEFTTENIVHQVNEDRNLAQYPRLFVKRQGNGLPITLSMQQQAGDTIIERPIKPTQLPIVLVAFHLSEAPSDDAVSDLTHFLSSSMIPISIVGAIPVDSTLLLIELPEFFLDFLRLDKCYIVLWQISKIVVIDRNRL
jgi:hypothetical protein